MTNDETRVTPTPDLDGLKLIACPAVLGELAEPPPAEEAATGHRAHLVVELRAREPATSVTEPHELDRVLRDHGSTVTRPDVHRLTPPPSVAERRAHLESPLPLPGAVLPRDQPRRLHRSSPVPIAASSRMVRRGGFAPVGRCPRNATRLVHTERAFVEGPARRCGRPGGSRRGAGSGPSPDPSPAASRSRSGLPPDPESRGTAEHPAVVGAQFEAFERVVREQEAAVEVDPLRE